MRTANSPMSISNLVQSLAYPLAGILALSGCVAPPTQTAIPVTVAARSADAVRLKRVAVLPFERRSNVDVTAEIEAALAGITVEGKTFFTVVERQRINELLRELKRQESGLVDPQTALQVGKMLGAKGVYTGAITRADTSDSNYNEARRRCTQHETLRDKKGKPYQGRCVSYQSYNVSCTRRVSVFSFAPKLVDVETGRIVYATDLKGDAEAAVCADEGKPLASQQELFDQAKRKAIDQFRRDIAPSSTTLRVTILEETSLIKSEAAKQTFGQGVAFAKGGRMDRACEFWNQILETEAQAFQLVYNVGVCHESQGNLTQAFAMYERADRLLTAPNNVVSSALARVRRNMDNEQKLRTQIGTPVVPVSQPAGASKGEVRSEPAAPMSLLEAQQRLMALGYKPGRPDGKMGRMTMEALKSFQRDKGLPSTGQLDPKTAENLR